MTRISARRLFYHTYHYLIVKCLLPTVGICLILAASSFPAFAQRVQSTPTPGSRLPIAGNVPAAVADATPVAAMPGNQTLSLSVSLKLPNAQAIADLIASQNNVKSPLYHKYLTPAEFTSRFAPSQASINSVVSFLRGAGFTITSISSNRLLIDATGTIAQANAAFNTQLYTYNLAQRQVMAPQQTPSLPSSVAALVQDVGGLNTVNVNHPIWLQSNDKSTSASATPAATPQVINPHPRTGFSPGNLRDAYQVTSLINNGDNGSGERIAIFEQGPYLLNDVLTYRSTYGLPNGPINNYTVDGASSTGDASGTLEADLDLEVASGLSPYATLDVLTAPNTTQGTNDLYNLFVTANQDKILTTSWGICEPQSSPSELQTLDNLFAQAATQGQTMLAASGDTGSDDCYNRDTGQSSGLPPSVDSPASDPYFIGVGGTTLSFNGTYQGESVWNSRGVAGGGGVSSYFAKPAWQVGAGVNNSYNASNKREVPDITGVADQTPGYNTYCTSVHDCSIGANVIGWAIVGGTSATAPLYAGMLADIDTYLRAGGKSLGWANQQLYQLFAYSVPNRNALYGMFNDITSGNNDIDYGSTPYSGDYPATACFDLASGMGSLNGYNIALVAAIGTTPGTESSCAPPTLTTQYTAPTSVTVPGTPQQNEFAAVGSDGYMYFATQDGTKTLNSNSWTVNWYKTPGVTFSQNPISIYDPANNEVEFAARGTDGHLYFAAQDATKKLDGYSWVVGWYSIGGNFSGDPTVVYDPAKQELEFALIGSDGRMNFATQDATKPLNSSSWIVNWYATPGGFFGGSPPAGVYDSVTHEIEFAAIGNDDYAMYFVTQDATKLLDGNSWIIGWYATPGAKFSGSPAGVFDTKNNQIEFAGTGTNYSMYFASQDGTKKLDGGSWLVGWYVTPGPSFFGSPTGIYDQANNQIEFAEHGNDGHLYFATQDGAHPLNGNSWLVGWYSTGGAFAYIISGLYDPANKEIEFAVRGIYDDHVYVVAQDAMKTLDGGSWLVGWYAE